MLFKKILVAYDGSRPSRSALEMARDFGILDDSVEIVLANVSRIYASGNAAFGLETIMADDLANVKAELNHLADQIQNRTHVRVLKGSSPADLLLQCARDEDCDLIIMGNRGKGGVKGYLGSVSYAVTKDSPVAVLIAKG